MMRYIAFYKPYQTLCQFSQEEHSSSTLADFRLPAGVYPAGRLDKDSEGLLFLTNDGSFNQRVTNPKNDKSKTYWVQVDQIPTKEALQKLSKGVMIKGYKTKTCTVKLLDPAPEVIERHPPIRYRANIPTSWLEITLTEGKNRQVRRMTAAIGHPTLRLIRVSIGKLHLKDLSLKPGQWVEVKKNDILTN